MKRIFFYANIVVDDMTIGITKKVFSQIEALCKMGYEVYYTGYTQSGVAIFNNYGEIVKEGKFFTKSNTLNRYLRRWVLLNFSYNFIKETKIKFNYGYLRFHFFDRAYLKLLKELKKNNVINIIEAHAYPYKTGKLGKKTPIYIIDTLYTPLVRKYIDLVAGICNTNNIWEIKTVNIDNGINLSVIPMQKKVEIEDSTIRMLSVAKETPFHGYDKIIKGLYNYYKNGGKRKVILNLVGNYLSNTKKLIKKLNLEDYVVFYGKMYGSELDEVYNNNDIGIGAFSHRKNETTGSCIKTKEYFAKGLPFINGWREPAFDDSYPYVKRFDSKTESIDIEEVISFYDSIKDHKKMAVGMRKFAEENYTWEVQFRKVFEAIKDIKK